MSAGPAATWARAQIASWGLDVPVPDVGGDRVSDWLESGAVELTGRADGPALVPPGAAASAARGLQLAFASLGHEDAGFGWHRLLGERAALRGLGRRAPWSPGGASRAVATADGWVALSLTRPDDVEAVPALVEADVAVDDAAKAWRLVDEWAAQCAADDVVERATLLGLPCGAIPPRGEWHARDRLQPGAATDPVRRAEVAAGEPQTDPPLVVDLSVLWAGPLCAHLLGLAGARVVKVELAGRLDGARRGNQRFYDLLHAGHESIVLDPAEPADHAVLVRLLDGADVVIESSRPRALAALGIDALEVCRRGPTTWVSITAYGRTSPDRVGFGDDVAMAAGLVAREPGDERPIPCGDALADPLTGMHAAVAAMASHRVGGSRLLDVSMCDVVAATLAWCPAESQPAVGDVPQPLARPAPPEPAAAAGRHTASWR